MYEVEDLLGPNGRLALKIESTAVKNQVMKMEVAVLRR